VKILSARSQNVTGNDCGRGELLKGDMRDGLCGVSGLGLSAIDVTRLQNEPSRGGGEKCNAQKIANSGVRAPKLLRGGKKPPSQGGEHDLLLTARAEKNGFTPVHEAKDQRRSKESPALIGGKRAFSSAT